MKDSDVKIAMAVESKYLYARDDAMRNATQNKLNAAQKTTKDLLAQKTSLLGAASQPGEALAGTKRKYAELKNYMSEDSGDFEEQIKSRQQKRARKDEVRREQKFESGSEEEYVVGNTMAKKHD